MSGTAKHTRPPFGPALALLLAIAGAGLTMGQTTTAPAGARPDSLRAELSVDRPLYRPDGPIWLRFTLLNNADEPVEIPLDPPAVGGDGISLPPRVVFGTAEQPAINVMYGSEVARTPITPPMLSANGEHLSVLRLGPHAILGADVDIRSCTPLARYAGDFRVEWRPLDGRLGTVSTDFRVEARKEVIVVTDQGKMSFQLDYEAAPRNVADFLELVREGFYNGKIFHRVVSGFLLQGGSPTGDSSGVRPDGKLVPAEFRNVPFELGTLAMARKRNDPNSASCQFIIGLGRVTELDGQYTIIGQARDAESLRTLQQLAGAPTDKKDRPIAPITIRSVNLVDVDQVRVRNLELHPTNSQTQPSAAAAKPRP
jgi:cyclophilin family peptidyl-prolyl cis-trans isomerase